MQTIRFPETAARETTGRAAPDESARGPFASDLTDLFAAIAVVVPVAWLLKILLS